MKIICELNNLGLTPEPNEYYICKCMHYHLNGWFFQLICLEYLILFSYFCTR